MRQKEIGAHSINKMPNSLGEVNKKRRVLSCLFRNPKGCSPVWRFVGIILGVLMGGYLLGVERYMTTGDTTKTESSFDVVTETIRINLLETLIGALIGAFIGYLGVVLLHYVLTRCSPVPSPSQPNGHLESYTSSKEFSRPEEYNVKKNVLTFVIFVALAVVIFGGLAVALWIAPFFMTQRFIWEPETILQVKTLLQHLALFSLVFSWLIVGRKISLKPSWRAKKDFVLLGPFNFVDVPFMNNKQLKVLWVGIVFICLLCLFPPWVGYEFASEGQGVGKGDFIGYHFILQREDLYGILGEAPYATAEISWTMFAAFCLCVLLLCCVLMYVFRASQERIDQDVGGIGKSWVQ